VLVGVAKGKRGDSGRSTIEDMAGLLGVVVVGAGGAVG
jgi:hypothetical protein